MSFRYGLVQARIKIPVARGIWPGFWMLGQDFDRTGWPGCGEIDVMEYFGTGRRVVQGAVHGPGYSGALGIAASRRMGSSLDKDFCVYSVSWEPGRIRWFVNGRHYHTVTPADLRGNRGSSIMILPAVNAAVGGVASQPPDRSTVVSADHADRLHPRLRPPGDQGDG
jgi:beta-glucanase (GH16 family)